MNIRAFRSGRKITQDGYKCFVPNFINHEWVLDVPELQSLVEEATAKVSALNAYSLMIPDVDLFIRMHIAKEATTSSRIEGTQTDMEEAMLSKQQVKEEHRDDWQEVHNYIDATNFAIRQLNKIPLSNRLFKETHAVLMQGVRGRNKAPGEFRRSQNWIGGTSPKDATFVPPPHHEVGDLMSDLEKFLHNEELYVPHLVRIGIAHYQFETIHPFLDGNGRLGRLMITLYLVNHKVLEKPSLYLSDFFERHRQLYYDNLSAARINNNIMQWLKFFLVGIIETAEKSTGTFKAILVLKEKIENKKLPKLGRRTPFAKNVLDFLYTKPVLTVADIMDELKVSKPTANSIVTAFVKLGILEEQTGYKRNRIFIFKEYLDLFKKE